MSARKSSILIVIAAILIALSVLYWSKNNQENNISELDTQNVNPVTKVSFRLKWLIYSSFASHFVALDKGYFAEQGLDVSIQPGGPGIDPIRLVATGNDLVGLAGYEQILIARSKGIPLVAIGEDYIRSGVGFFSLKDSGIEGPSDFIGRNVGILPGTDKHSLYLALLAKTGVDQSKINEVPVAFDLTLLFNNIVDVFPGFITNQPFFAAEKGFPVNIIDPYDYDVRPGGNVYFTTEEALRTKRDVLKGFLRAALKGIVHSQQMPNEEVVDIVMDYNAKLDRNAELKIWQATKDVLLEKNASNVGYMSDETWSYTAKIAEEYGLVPVAPDLAKTYTNELIEEIHAEGL